MRISENQALVKKLFLKAKEYVASSKLPFLTFFLRFMAVDLFIMSKGIIGNKMKEFFFFSFQGVKEPLNKRLPLFTASL